VLAVTLVTVAVPSTGATVSGAAPVVKLTTALCVGL